ncbi:hypothetical protein ACIGNX_13155 [Actinosynnema sp. NPDC053489]|uniref:hypothetical protein n=1 Tax=Actinosynnema sp. NPDC053489 TaxID=3363916 RepID=UPI0037C76267
MTAPDVDRVTAHLRDAVAHGFDYRASYRALDRSGRTTERCEVEGALDPFTAWARRSGRPRVGRGDHAVPHRPPAGTRLPATGSGTPR